MNPLALLRPPEVLAMSGQSRSTLYSRIAQGLWTRPVKLGLRASAWPAYEADALNGARIAEKSESEIRGLVTKLTVARKGGLIEALGENTKGDPPALAPGNAQAAIQGR